VRSVNFVASDAHNIIFCAHLLRAELIERIPPDSIIFNSEALEDVAERRFYQACYPQLLERFFVWDYSARNLPLIAHERKAVIPFLHCERLRRTDLARAAGDSLLFYGRINERRRMILEELQRRGLPVRVLTGHYDRQRDVHMMAARAVLNLHKTDDTETFESIRCFYPLINGVPVISEAVHDDAAQAFEASVFFAGRASLVEDLVWLARDRADFEARSQAMLAAFQRTDPRAAIRAAVDQFRSQETP